MRKLMLWSWALLLLASFVVPALFVMMQPTLEQREAEFATEQAELQRITEHEERDPEYQRLKRLDKTPGAGGTLVDAKEVLPRLESNDALPIVALRAPSQGEVDPAITEYDVQRIARKEIERDRLQRTSCHGPDCW